LTELHSIFRGQESAGIVTTQGDEKGKFHVHKGMGLINNVFNDDAMKKLKGWFFT